MTSRLTHPAALLAAAATLAGSAALTVAPAAHAEPAPAAASGTSEPYLVGRASADITGPVAENGMMGYSLASQVTSGLWQRERARAFVVADPTSGKRIAYVVGDMGMDFRTVDEEVQRRLAARGYADRYNRDNVMISGTHTHAGPGGYSGNIAYNLATNGFQPQLLDAIAGGITDAIVAADADLEPGSIAIGRGTLTGASANRSRSAFSLDPAADQALFPNAVDPTTTVLRFSQGGTEVGMVDWFPVHSTSLPNTSTLVAGDNKGYAAYRVEHDVKGVDYLAKDPGAYVAAFAAGAQGDLSPNLDLKPATSTAEGMDRAVTNGTQQADAALATATPTQVTGSIDYRKRYLDFGKISVSPRYTGDGMTHMTCGGAIGASLAAGAVEDGPALAGFYEGMVSPTATVAAALHTPVPAALKGCQYPKAVLAPTGALGITQDVLPLSVIKLGQLAIVGIPGEMTQVAGRRVRQAVADAVGTPIDNVLLQPYTGDYFDYTTTPEEYDSQQYEGASTLFGKWQTPAIAQESAKIAAGLAAGLPTPDLATPKNPPFYRLSWQPGVVYDIPLWQVGFGGVKTAPKAAYSPGEQVTAVFGSAHPKNDLRRGGTYLEVQRLDGGTWKRVADDSDASTTFTWKRVLAAQSTATITWAIPAGTPAGSYRIVHHGAAKDALGRISQFSGATAPFTVG